VRKEKEREENSKRKRKIFVPKREQVFEKGNKSSSTNNKQLAPSSTNLEPSLLHTRQTARSASVNWLQRTFFSFNFHFSIFLAVFSSLFNKNFLGEGYERKPKIQHHNPTGSNQDWYGELVDEKIWQLGIQHPERQKYPRWASQQQDLAVEQDFVDLSEKAPEEEEEEGDEEGEREDH